jgi:hypothetical protein
MAVLRGLGSSLTQANEKRRVHTIKLVFRFRYPFSVKTPEVISSVIDENCLVARAQA